MRVNVPSMFRDYVIRKLCQQMSHDVRYGKFYKSRQFRHMAFVGQRIVDIHISTLII
jgi:hypothetical protein